MSFWNSIQQIVSDAGTSIASINVGDSARKLVGRTESQGDNEAETVESLEKSRVTNPPRPGCPLVVPEPSNENASTKGSETTQHSFFPRLYGTATFLKRVNTDSISPQTSVESENPPSQRPGSFKANAQRFFNVHKLSGDNESLEAVNGGSTDRSSMGKTTILNESRKSLASTEDYPGRRKGVSIKRSSKQSSKINKPNCFMEMPQRWAEVTETRSG